MVFIYSCKPPFKARFEFYSLQKAVFTLGQYLLDAVPWVGGPVAPLGRWGGHSPAAARNFPFAALGTGRNKEPGGGGEGRREE